MPIIDEIPAELRGQIDILVVDNCSLDGTLTNGVKANAEGRWPRPVEVV